MESGPAPENNQIKPEGGMVGREELFSSWHALRQVEET